LNTSSTDFEESMLIFSIDVDVGSKALGEINRGENDMNVRKSISEYRLGEIEELALPLFVEMFNYFEIPVTFAVRGQLAEAENTVFDMLKSPVKHDIAAHGYYHRKFTSLTRNEAMNELCMISTSMKKLGIKPQTFIFPANRVAYLDLLENHKYKCYRGYGDFLRDCMKVEKIGKLYNIHPSLYISHLAQFTLAKRILNISVAKKLPLHIWFHLWNFGQSEGDMRRSINSFFVPLVSYAKKLEEKGLLAFETMLSAAEKAEKSGS
jgi:hypothetical protein